jgi:predicted outer membrane repeat protein
LTKEAPVRFAIVFALALLCPAVSVGDVIYVDVAGGGDYQTLQEGFAAADTGDTILVAPGTYSGPANLYLDINGKNVKFISESGPEVTIIDGGGTQLAFFFDDDEDSTSVVKGFTIRNGYRSSRGGAIPIYGASPIIEDCIFLNCEGSTGGAIAIRYSEASPIIRNCVFLNNHANSRGGAIYVLSEPSLTLTNCVFAGNTAQTFGGVLDLGSGTSVTVTNCTFYGNRTLSGDACIESGDTPGTYSNCVFAYNGDDPPIDCSGSPEPTITHCISYGHTASDSLCGNHYDNLFVDPLFCNVFEDNFELCSNSPCLPGNNSWSELVGAYGQGCGECDALVETTAWGEIKSIFR